MLTEITSVIVVLEITLLFKEGLPCLGQDIIDMLHTRTHGGKT